MCKLTPLLYPYDALEPVLSEQFGSTKEMPQQFIGAGVADRAQWTIATSCVTVAND